MLIGYNGVFERLSKSKFRSQFHLTDKDYKYIKEKGMDKIREHATATCCRGCLNKWYKIPSDRDLTEKRSRLYC